MSAQKHEIPNENFSFQIQIKTKNLRTFVPSLRGARQTAEIIPIEPD